MEKDEFLKGLLKRTSWYFNAEEVDKIQNQTIVLVGLGGIGALVLELLARLGVMKFRIMDMDRYEITNMNRQVFATASGLGSLKTEVAVARVKEINPYSQIEMAIAEKANKENAERIIKGADIFIDETDYPSSKFLFRHFARKYRVPIINGHCVSVTGGAVRIFDYRNTRQVDGDRYFAQPLLNYMACKMLGQKKSLDDFTTQEIEDLDKCKTPTASLNFVTNLIACIVVSEAVKLMTGKGKVYCYPKEIILDVPRLKIKVCSSRSPKKIIGKILCKQ